VSTPFAPAAGDSPVHSRRTPVRDGRRLRPRRGTGHRPFEADRPGRAGNHLPPRSPRDPSARRGPHPPRRHGGSPRWPEHAPVLGSRPWGGPRPSAGTWPAGLDRPALAGSGRSPRPHRVPPVHGRDGLAPRGVPGRTGTGAGPLFRPFPYEAVASPRPASPTPRAEPRGPGPRHHRSPPRRRTAPSPGTAPPEADPAVVADGRTAGASASVGGGSATRAAGGRARGPATGWTRARTWAGAGPGDRDQPSRCRARAAAGRDAAPARRPSRPGRGGAADEDGTPAPRPRAGRRGV